MPKMKDSGIEWIGEIPKDWNVHPIYYYFGERKNKNSLGLETNLLSLSYGKIIRKDINANGGLLPESFNTYNIVEPGDIIIRPTDLQNDKRSLRTGLVTEHGIITSAYIDLKAIKSVNTSYYHYLLHAFDVMKVFYNMGNGVRQGLNFSEFSKLMVFEPSRAEQDAIVDYLDNRCVEIDALTSDIESQIDMLEQYKRSVITEAVTKGLNPDAEMKDSGVEWIGEIPKDWDIIKIKYITKLRNEKGLFNPDADSYIGLENVHGYSNQIFETDSQYEQSIQCICHKNDVMFGKLRPYLAKVIISPIDGFCTGEFLQIKKFDGDIRYLRYFLLVPGFIDAVNSSTYGTKMPRANSDFILNLCMTHPAVTEQQQIADYLDDKCSNIDAVIADNQAQLDTLAEYKKSLIYEYVIGKKEVPTS